MLDIARHRLERGGINTRTLSKEDVFFPGRGSWFARRAAGVHTSSDFPLLLSAAASKALATIFAAVESPLKQIARRNDRGDFKAGSMINIGAFPALEEVPEAGEIKLGTVDESAESWKLKSYGKRFALSFQAMVNDDLGQFSDWSRMCAISAAQAEGDVLFALLSANSYAGSTLSDNVALFDAAHSNLASPGTAFDVTNFGAAVAALRQQRALGATAALGVAPKFVLCGPKKELQVRQVLSATIVPNTAGAVNPWAGVVQPLIEPRFAARSDWYAFADASVWPVLEYGYLSDQAGPQVQTQEGWQTLSIECRLVLHFGAGVVDYRGAYRNPGA